MKPAVGWLIVTISCLSVMGLYGTSRGAISSHLDWGQIIQGRFYDDPNLAEPLYFFTLELETDATVDYIEFITPGGFIDVIPSDEYTALGDVETYHWTYDSTHVWEYWGYFTDAGTLSDYGDGLYRIVLHYTNGASEQTTVWYGVPGTNEAMAAPTQRPHLTWPVYDGAVASPATFTWAPVTDPAVADIYLGVIDTQDEYVISDIYDWDRVNSDAYSLGEGRYDIEFTFENFYAVTSSDGVPFDLLKTSALLQPFEVIYSTVYRFWSPITGTHFYTIDETEKDAIVAEYSYAWIFEGPAFHAWATDAYPGLAPVHRFWSDTWGSHFYTISDDEKNRVMRDYGDVWSYEGVAFYAFPEGSQPPDALPVYRFRNVLNNTHFYTIDALEADTVIAEYSHVYIFEGIAYYAYD